MHKSERVHLAIRVRGPDDGQTAFVPAKDGKGVSTERGDKYTADHVFGQAATTAEMYETCVRHISASVMDGYSGSVVAYGQTGSGKTFTMMGDADGGIIGLCAQHLTEAAEARAAAGDPIVLSATFCEVYEEQVRDLFLTRDKPVTQLRVISNEDSSGFQVTGLRSVAFNSAKALMAKVKTGALHRVTASTVFNPTSSRSHAILRLCAEGRKTAAEMLLVDLAGSERSHEGTDGRETASINSSLLCLARVIGTLSDMSGQRASAVAHTHVPYRDSVLTMLLKQSLGGNSKTVMLACVRPDRADESHSTLQWATKVTKISNHVKRKTVKKSRASKEETNGIISRLREELNTQQAFSGRVSDILLHVQPDAAGAFRAVSDIVDAIPDKDPRMNALSLALRAQGVTLLAEETAAAELTANSACGPPAVRLLCQHILHIIGRIGETDDEEEPDLVP